MKETREQKEERRYLAGYRNPKKDWWARRRGFCKWFMGKCLTIVELIKARKEQVESQEGKIIGYDFDGVIATEMGGWFSSLMWKWFPKWWCIIVHRFAKYTGVMPEKNSYIISGRMGCERGITEKQLTKWGIENIWLVITPDKIFPNQWQSINLKIKSIKGLGINIFHENDDKTIEELEKEFGNKLQIIKH